MSQDHAIWHGVAINRALNPDERLEAAMNALTAYEAEVSRLRTELDEARQIIRRVHQAIREHTTAAAVALAMVSKGDGPPSFLDEIDALRAQVAEHEQRRGAEQRVLDAAREWRAARGRAVPTSDFIGACDALIAAVDALPPTRHREQT
jgi:hypothetical protein